MSGLATHQIKRHGKGQRKEVYYVAQAAMGRLHLHPSLGYKELGQGWRESTHS
jgi:hypothetical protein